MLLSSLLHRTLAAALACTASLALWQTLTVHYSYGGNWTALYCTGSMRPTPPALASEHIYPFPGAGYDGQFFHYMAHDPWFRRSISLASIDNPRLRCRRILAPGLAYLLALGQDRFIDATYIGLIWLSTFLGAYWLARLAEAPWMGLLFALVPAVLISADRLVVDGALAACCVGFVLYAREQSKWKLYAVLAAGRLVRETGRLLSAAYVIWLAGKRRWREALLYATAALPAICWFWFVRRNTPPDNYHFFSPAFFQPLLQRILHPAAYSFGPAINALAVGFDFLALFGFAAAGIWILWRRRWTPAVLAGGLFLALAMTISDPDVWADPFGYSRIYTPLVLLGALEGLAARSLVPWLAMLAMAPRILLQLGPQLLHVMRGITR